MSNFVYDSFTAADATAVDARSGETGATWTKHASYSSGGSAIYTNALEGTTFNDSFYWASGAPAGAEYDVSASWKALIVGSDYGGGIIGRVDTAAATCYAAEHYAGTWYLAKIVGGTRTGLGTYAQTLVNGTTYVLKLEIRNATKKLFVDGVERVSSADNSITAAGKAGVKLYQGAVTHANALLDFTATDVSSAATASTLSGPTSGVTGVASTNFTVGANGTITGTVTVTPSDAAGGGTFTPTSVAISSGTPTGTFTYTPASTGVKTISISDDGGLTDATPLSYTSNAAGGYAPWIFTPQQSGFGTHIFGAR